MSSSAADELDACAVQACALLETLQLADWRTWLDAKRTARSGDLPVVVVAGESKRGKSAFVNALLGQEGLSPSGYEQITSAYIVFGYAPEPGAVVRLRDGTVTAIPLSDLATWATEQGNPDNERGVASVEVGVPAPLLRDFCVIDTPGTGSLHAGHGELTLLAVARADALLFVVDAGSPITAAELSFLQRAASSVEYVAVVLVKVDQYSGWRVIRRDDERLLATAGAELSRAAVLPVRSTLVFAERDEPGIRAEAGLDEVERFLRARVLAMSGVLTQANLARACLTALDTADQRLRAAYDADGSAQMRAELAAEEQALAALASDGATWRKRVEEELKARHEDSRKTIERRLREVSEQAQQRIQDGAARKPDDFVDSVTGTISALAAELQGRASATAAELAAEMLTVGGKGTTADLAVGSDLLSGDGWKVPLPGERKKTPYEHMLALTAFSSAHGLALLALPVLGALLGGVGGTIAAIGAGAVGARLSSKGRSQLSRESDLRAWLAKQIAAASARLTSDQQKLMKGLYDDLTQLGAACIAERQAEVAAAISEHTTALAASEEATSERRTQVELARASLAELQDRVTSVLGSLRAAAARLHDAPANATEVDAG